MRDFQHKRRWKRVLYSKGVLLLLFVLLIILVQATWGVFQKQLQAGENASVVDRELFDLQKRNDTLATQIDRLETDRGMEDVIRDSYQVAKAGESIVVVIDEKKEATMDTAKPKTFWDKIKAWFR